MSVLAGRRLRRLALTVTAAAAAVLAATAGGVAQATTVSVDPVAMATASSASGTTQPAAPSWPVDNLGQPVVRALSTDTALGGGGGTSNGPAHLRARRADIVKPVVGLQRIPDH